MADSKNPNNEYRVAGDFSAGEMLKLLEAMTNKHLPMNSKATYEVVAPVHDAVLAASNDPQSTTKFKLVICRRDKAPMTNKEKTTLYYYLHGVLVGSSAS